MSIPTDSSKSPYLEVMDSASGSSRRRFLSYAAAMGLSTLVDSLLPAYARAHDGLRSDARAPGEPIDLFLRRREFKVGDRVGRAVTLNGTVPGPLLRLYEGEDVTIRVHNELDESSSVHWHGILLPFEMDGVPGVSYRGIEAGETFTYRFPVRQSGTYWYHSHTGLQEQLGHYGPLIVEPIETAPYAYDREHVVVFSDWTFENPYKMVAKIKKMSGYYNFQERTTGDFFDDVDRMGFGATVRDRMRWGRMRMTPTDIADVTGYTYTYLVNGLAPESNWTGLFTPGERVRLRFINAATMTYFNVRIPGLAMTVVQADGQDVEPVETDEIQMGVAETYDVIVEPKEDRAYTLFSESLNRSGYGRGTLAPREGMSAPIPAMRERPLRTMIDMGMDMGAMSDMGNAEMGDMSAGAKGHEGHMQGMEPPPPAGDAQDTMAAMSPMSPIVARHGPDRHGIGNLNVAQVERNRLGEPGAGLVDVGHRVLVYNDLRRVADDFDHRAPERDIELHLTGNMDRYMWSFDGKKFSETKGPIEFHYGERLRLILVNDTMMEHPIHLHGMWMELENGHGARIPRKHTVSVKPAERLSVLISADARGRWAFHCHLLLHMDMGMFRVVRVSDREV